MTVADFIADFFYKRNVKNIYMLSGTGSVILDDAFARKTGMKYICARHEATAVIMAEAESKLTNDISVAVVTTGPGGTNAMSGVIEAWVDSTPVFVISGQVEKKQIINDRAFGIQGFNIIDNVKNFTKYCALVDDPKLIRYHLEKAYYYCKKGRPGPVWLDIPMDLQGHIIDEDNLVPFIPSEKFETKNIDESIEKIEYLIHLLSNSKTPLVAFGQGIKLSNTQNELEYFLNKLHIPSISARMGNDVLDNDHLNYYGMGGIRGTVYAAKIMQSADLFLCLGSSSCHTFLGDNGTILSEGCKKIYINIDETLFGRPDLTIDLGIQIDLRNFFDIIIPKLNSIENNLSFIEWNNKCQEIKKTYSIVDKIHKNDVINSYIFIDELSKYTNEKHIFVNDAGSSNYISSQVLKFKKGQKELTSGAFYTMGLTLPLAIGAAVSTPDAQVLAVTGDGSIELNIQELQTINLNNLNIKIFVINNGGYASIRASQDSMCGGRYTDSEQILNFEKVADAFNLDFEIINSYDDFSRIIPNVLSNDRPTIIEVVCDSNQNMVLPFKELNNG